jgi:hypothetical protein
MVGEGSWTGSVVLSKGGEDAVSILMHDISQDLPNGRGAGGRRFKAWIFLVTHLRHLGSNSAITSNPFDLNAGSVHSFAILASKRVRAESVDGSIYLILTLV